MNESGRMSVFNTMNSVHSADGIPHFTVIIPCKNRGEYLRHTLRTCSSQTYERLEIIVSDDGSVDNTKAIVQEAADRDPRIRYISPPGRGGMRDNFEHALSCVKPGFVIALGGDDGLMPNGIADMRDLLRETGTELLTWPAPVYTYANVRGPRGQLTMFRDRGVRMIESRQFLFRQAKRLHYLSDVETPMFYVKGVASTRIIEQVRQRSSDGRFYSCATPDGYSGIVLAGEVDRYAFSARPLAIYGLSPTSQGLAYLSNSTASVKESEKFFEDVAPRPMHAELASQPYSPLITLMTVDYLLTARDLPGWNGDFPAINYRKVLSNAVQELAHGLYGTARITRELRILNNIAEKHSMGEYFRSKVKGARRWRQREAFIGTGINARALLFDAAQYNMHNIVDAASVASTLHQVYNDLGVANIGKTIARSLRYRFGALQKGDAFPPDGQWTERK
jgi:glycosyltransferase involved in cell wall biosynthesis